MDFLLAWRNIWRNPRRTLLTMSAIAFASALLVFMLSFQFGSYEASINNALLINTGHLQVQRADFLDKRGIREVVPDPGFIRAGLAGMEGVAGHTARAMTFCLVSSQTRTRGAMITGVRPASETRVSTLSSLVREGGYFEKDDENAANEALVGRLLARNLKVGIGDELVVLGQGRDGSVAAMMYTIRGIYASGQDEFDRSAIHIPLASFQSTFFMRGAAHAVVVRAEDLNDVQICFFGG